MSETRSPPSPIKREVWRKTIDVRERTLTIKNNNSGEAIAFSLHFSDEVTAYLLGHGLFAVVMRADDPKEVYEALQRGKIPGEKGADLWREAYAMALVDVGKLKPEDARRRAASLDAKGMRAAKSTPSVIRHYMNLGGKVPDLPEMLALEKTGETTVSTDSADC